MLLRPHRGLPFRRWTTRFERTALVAPILWIAMIASIAWLPMGCSSRGSDDLEDRFRTDPAGRGAALSHDGPFSLESIDLDLKDLMAALEQGFEAMDIALVREQLTTTFRGSTPGPNGAGLLVAIASDPTSGSQVTTASSGVSRHWSDDSESFGRALAGYFAGFDYVYEAFFKVKQYVDDELFRNRISAKVKLDLRARRKDGGIHQEFLVWKCSFVRRDAGWKIDRMFLLSREQMSAARPMFTEITSAAGLAITEPPELSIPGVGNVGFGSEPGLQNRIYDYGGICLYDVDGDDDLDVFMPNAFGGAALFLNDGGKFVEDGARHGLRGAANGSDIGSRGAVFGDVDNDGDPDLYVCRAPFHHPGMKPGTNAFYHNKGDAMFELATESSGLGCDAPSMSAVFLDYDLDGDLDLYVANYGPRRNDVPHHPFNSDNGFANVLFRNEGDRKFIDVTAEAGLAGDTYWSFAVSACDQNKDRYPDLYVANDFGPNQFYRNNGDGTFSDIAEECGIVDIGNGMGVAFVDSNNDLIWDIYVSNMQSGTGRRVLESAATRTDARTYDALWKLTLGNSHFEGQATADGKAAHRFQGRAADLGTADCGWAWHADFNDFDADGDRDLLVMNGYFTGEEKKDC